MANKHEAKIHLDGLLPPQSVPLVATQLLYHKAIRRLNEIMYTAHELTHSPKR